MLYATARAVISLSFAVPRRCHSSPVKCLQSCTVARRTAANSSIRLASVRALKFRTGDVIILLKTGQRRLVVAADTECTVSKDAFGVRHMAYDFFDAPFAGRVRMARLLFRYRAQQRQSLFDL